MKKPLIIIALLVIAINTFAQHSETRKIGNINGISVSSSIEATYIISNRNEVVIEVENEDHLDKLETVVEGGKLHIRYKSHTSIRTRKSNRVTVYSSSKLQFIKVSSSASLRVESILKTPQIAIDISSSGKLFASHIITEKTAIDINSSGRFDAKIETSNLAIEGSSSSRLNLMGNAGVAVLDISSSANIDLSAMKIKDASIEASSSAKATVQVSGNLDADVSSSGKVYYIGKPQHINVEKSSSGQVSPK